MISTLRLSLAIVFLLATINVQWTLANFEDIFGCSPKNSCSTQLLQAQFDTSVVSTNPTNNNFANSRSLWVYDKPRDTDRAQAYSLVSFDFGGTFPRGRSLGCSIQLPTPRTVGGFPFTGRVKVCDVVGNADVTQATWDTKPAIGSCYGTVAFANRTLPDALDISNFCNSPVIQRSKRALYLIPNPNTDVELPSIEGSVPIFLRVILRGRADEGRSDQGR